MKEKKERHRYLIGAVEIKQFLFPPETETIKKFIVTAWSLKQAIFLLKFKLSKKKSFKIVFLKDLGEYTELDKERDRKVKAVFRVIKTLKVEKRQIELDFYGISIKTVNQYCSPVKIHFRLNTANKIDIDEIIFLGRDRLEDIEAEKRLTKEEYGLCIAIAEKYLRKEVRRNEK